jgi:O-antigen ligase
VAEALLWLLILALWWVHDPSSVDAFRMPKLWVGVLLTLASVTVLAWRLGEVDRIDGQRLRALWSRPAVAMALPLAVVAATSLWTTEHPLHTRAAVMALAVALLGLVGWQLGLPRVSRERLLAGLMLPAVALSLIAVLQVAGVYQPFDFARASIADQRMGLVSFAGNPGDLGMFLVLPILIGQVQIYRFRGRWQGLWAAATALALVAISLTQTLTALAALAVGTLLLWATLVPRRRWLAALAAVTVLGVVLALAVTPLRERVLKKGGELLEGKTDALLSGRLDGWHGAVQMFHDHPWTGVGHGAYRAEFVPTKMALHEAGVEFSRLHPNAMFLNAHSEPLEVAAELGVPGVLVLLWGLWVVGRALGRRWRSRAAGDWRYSLALAGCVALGVLSLAQFPFRIALVGFPAVLFLSWALDGDGETEVAA